MKTCHECGAEFTPTRDWSRFCGQDCRIANNNRRLNALAVERRRRRAERQMAQRDAELDDLRPLLNAPLTEAERKVCEEGAYNLCIGIMKSAYQDNDREFFGTDLARAICDAVGVDPQVVRQKAWEQ